jgi:hypothetical protein
VQAHPTTPRRRQQTKNTDLLHMVFNMATQEPTDPVPASSASHELEVGHAAPLEPDSVSQPTSRRKKLALTARRTPTLDLTLTMATRLSRA